MLRLAVSRQARGVGGEESKGRFRVAAILGQVENHPTDQIPCGMAALEELLQRTLRRVELTAQSRVELGPERAQDLRRQILRAPHRRRIGHQGIERLVVGRGQPNPGGIERGAQRRHIMRGEIPPPAQSGRQHGAYFRRTQMQQTVSRTKSKGVDETLLKFHGEGMLIGIRRQQQMSMRRQHWRNGAGFNE